MFVVYLLHGGGCSPVGSRVYNLQIVWIEGVLPMGRPYSCCLAVVLGAVGAFLTCVAIDTVRRVGGCLLLKTTRTQIPCVVSDGRTDCTSSSVPELCYNRRHGEVFH